MIAHAGDNSNLILDPELDTYYLMDATLMALPQTQDRLTQVMVDGADLIQGKGTNLERDRTNLALDVAFLKTDDLDRNVSSVQIGLNNGNPLYGEHPTLHQRVPEQLQRYATAASRFNDLASRVQQGDKTVKLDEYLAAGEATRDTSFRFWTVLDEELSGLLQGRIDYYTARRLRSLGVAACALVAAIFLVTFITRSISGPLKKQAAALKRANDELSLARELLEVRVEKSHEQLRRTEDKYRSIFENSVMGIFQKSPDGRLLSANPALARIYGYDLTEGFDAVHQRYVDPGRRKQFLESISRGGAVVNFESQIYRKDASFAGSARTREKCATQPESCFITKAASRTSRSENAPKPRSAARSRIRKRLVALPKPRARRRGGQHGQERFPGQHEPRNSHTAQWRHWHDRSAEAHTA